jgi:ubiquinone/menaquinone biosynthesis C-methylase UbiE
MSSEAVSARIELQRQRAAELERHLLNVLAPLTGRERALDAGCGVGALAYALAPHVGEVIGVDADEELLAAARSDAPANCSFVKADVTALPFRFGEFDIAGCLRVLHHVRRPELVVSELARVTRPGGVVLVVDQLGATDPLVSLEIDRFERERDPTHTRLLPDGDIRTLLEANALVVRSAEIVKELRDVEQFLDVAGLEGDHRERVRGMAPGARYEIEVGWYAARVTGG